VKGSTGVNGEGCQNVSRHDENRRLGSQPLPLDLAGFWSYEGSL
jgi:hypothetical protein